GKKMNHSNRHWTGSAGRGRMIMFAGVYSSPHHARNGLMKGKATSLDLLNEREKEIVKRLSTGLSDQQIADELFLSLNTVKWYNRQIYSKLGVKSRTQAIARVKDPLLPDRVSGVSTSSLPLARYNRPAQTLFFTVQTRYNHGDI